MAGRDSNPSGNCCIMGEGFFAVVPSSFLSDGNASDFLPLRSARTSLSDVSCHSISDSLSLVSDTSGWPVSCPCHEIEPMLVDCLKSEGDAVHVSLYGNRLYIAVMRRNLLVMANRFCSNCNEDTLYHILAAYMAFDLDRLTHPLIIHGKMKSNYLKKFIVKCV